MSPDLARHLVRPLLAKHQLPWRIEYDWTAEVYDAKKRLVIKLPSGALAEELIALATELAAYDAQGAASAKKVLAEAGIEIED